ERGAFAVRSALELRTARTDWEPPVLLTIASQGTGVAEVVERFEAHLQHLEATGGLERRRRQRLEQRVIDMLREQVWRATRAAVTEDQWRDAIDSVFERRCSPHQAAETLLAIRDQHSPNGERVTQGAKDIKWGRS